MKRDYDLLREILLKVEEEYKGGLIQWKMADLESVFSREKNVVEDHMLQLVEKGFLRPQIDRSWRNGSSVYFGGISFDGHDFLDNIRDEKVWRKTKEGARQIGSFSLDVIRDVAKAIINKKVKQLTDGEFGFGGDEA